MANSRKMKVSGTQRKSITFDRKKFGTALAKAVLNGIPVGFSVAAGQPSPAAWAKMGENIVDLVASFSLKTSPEGLASKLIFTAAGQAAFELVREAMQEESKEDAQPTIAALEAMLTQSDPEALVTMLEEQLTAEPLEIDRHFFKDPAKPLPIDAIAEVLAHWLDRIGLTRPQTQAIANRFERYFVYALYDEWQSKTHDYAALLPALETPFDVALEKTMAWERYWAHLRRQVQLPMMAETFGLDAVYVHLRAYFVTKTCPDVACEEARAVFRRGVDERKTTANQHVVELHRYVHDWLKSNNKDDAIRLICGGPGSGKSSFVKMLAADIAGAEERLVFIPLSQNNPSEKLNDVVGNFLRRSGLLPFNPMDDNDKPLLLILDGLDELSLQGRSGAEAAQQLLEEVRSAVSVANYNRLSLRCLITGRDLAIQSVEHALHLESTSLHLLSYWIDRKKDVPNPSDPGNLLEKDQRDEWWRKYGQASGHDFDSMPKPLRGDQLQEISGQPLLNYLLAIVYAREPEKLVNVSRPTIYKQLLADVYTRDYKKPHFPLGELRGEEFLFVLEKIAVAIWHGDGRTASLRELKTHCEGARAQQLLKCVLAGVNKGLMRLLAAFYFRQAMQCDEKKKFEFTHKSFGEYLTARYIVDTLAELCEQARPSAQDRQPLWDVRIALQNWLALCGPQPMDDYLFSFVAELIADEPQEKCQEWQHFCGQLINGILNEGMSMETRAEGVSFKTQCQQARNAEAALLAVHCACARRTKTISKINWPSLTGLREWLSWLEPNAEPSIVRNSLAYLNLQQQILLGVKLNGSNLSGANLMQADLSEANLREADLRWADLSQADLSCANLFLASLEGVNLSGAELREATFMLADLQGANLQGAKLVMASLKSADLRGANLEGAELEVANLRRADLRGANLQGANLTGIRFGGADLTEAKLQGADLRGADLRGANFSGANISKARFQRVTFGEVDPISMQNRRLFRNTGKPDKTLLSSRSLLAASFEDPALRAALEADVDLSQLSSYKIGQPTPNEAAALAALVGKARNPRRIARLPR